MTTQKVLHCSFGICQRSAREYLRCSTAYSFNCRLISWMDMFANSLSTSIINSLEWLDTVFFSFLRESHFVVSLDMLCSAALYKASQYLDPLIRKITLLQQQKRSLNETKPQVQTDVPAYQCHVQFRSAMSMERGCLCCVSSPPSTTKLQ